MCNCDITEKDIKNIYKNFVDASLEASILDSAISMLSMEIKSLIDRKASDLVYDAFILSINERLIGCNELLKNKPEYRSNKMLTDYIEVLEQHVMKSSIHKELNENIEYQIEILAKKRDELIRLRELEADEDKGEE